MVATPALVLLLAQLISDLVSAPALLALILWVTATQTQSAQAAFSHRAETPC
jgi:hypothetical protein